MRQLLAALALVFLFIAPMPASVILSSTQSLSYNGGVFVGDELLQGRWEVADLFRTDASPYWLTSVSVDLRNLASDQYYGPNPAGQFVHIYTSAAGSVGAFYAALSLTGHDAYGWSVFAAPGVWLDAASEYWVVIGSTSDHDHSFNWAWTNQGWSGTGVGYSAIWRQSYDAGAHWGNGNLSNPGYAPHMAVVADSAVPEPATWGLSFFLIGLLIWRQARS